jgi:threonine dehydratase
MADVSLADIFDAQQRIRGGIVETPCIRSGELSDAFGAQIYLKLETMQRTGSFKERGARNALLLLDSDQRKAGVTAASAGNHALALAYHGRDLGIPVTVVMPRFAPVVKQARCQALGATVLLHGDDIGQAKDLANELVERENRTYIHGFDGAAVIAGQGTIGLEVVAQVPSLDTIVVPIGGGGLIAGVAMAAKGVRPGIEIIGIEPIAAASFRAAVNLGQPQRVEMTSTLADGLAVPEVGGRAFGIARDLIDGLYEVHEEWIARAILRLVESERVVVEGGGAIPLAALMAGQLESLRGKTVVLLVCGGNIDPGVLGRVIENAMVAEGRLTRFRTVISDRPGGLARLAESIAAAGASIRQITHERAFASADISTVEVDCIIETRNLEHREAVLAKLRHTPDGRKS